MKTNGGYMQVNNKLWKESEVNGKKTGNKMLECELCGNDLFSIQCLKIMLEGVPDRLAFYCNNCASVYYFTENFKLINRHLTCKHRYDYHRCRINERILCGSTDIESCKKRENEIEE